MIQLIAAAIVALGMSKVQILWPRLSHPGESACPMIIMTLGLWWQVLADRLVGTT